MKKRNPIYARMFVVTTILTVTYTKVYEVEVIKIFAY